MNKKRIFVLGFGLWLLAGILRAEELPSEIISLEEFIRTACRRDTYFKILLTEELGLRYAKVLRLPAGDIVLEVESRHNFFFRPGEGESQNAVSLSKLFPRAGTQVGAQYSSSLSSSTRDVSSLFDITISQPIAKNAFGRTTRLLDEIVGKENEIARYQIAEAYEDYLASLVILYYDWYAVHESLKTAENAYEDSLKLLENIKEREKHNIALPIDVNKIDLQVIAKKENLLGAKEEYREYVNLIKQAMRHEGESHLIPRDSSLRADIPENSPFAYEDFVKESRTWRVLKLLEEKGSLEVFRRADELLPSVKLFAGYQLRGDDHDIRNSNPEARVGMSLSWPLPDNVGLARKEMSLIDLERSTLTAENVSTRLLTDLKNLRQRIAREKELIGMAEQKIKLGRAIVKDEEDNYSLGRVSLKDLIDEINRLEDSKMSRIFHEIKLKKLQVEWLRLTDRLVRSADILSE